MSCGLMVYFICVSVCFASVQVSDASPLPADAADEAVWVVGPPQGRHHLSSDVLVTAVTLGPIEALVVLGADVLSRVVEETRANQVTAAH